MAARKGLGRGLETLLGEEPDRGQSGDGQGGGDRVTHLAIGDITPDPDQPRKRFDEQALLELTASIRTQGILQPILVRPKGPDGRYIIIAGERRWRAAGKAGVYKIPALIREVEDGTRAEMALIENLQRADLNPMEEADAYARMRDVHGRKATEIAEAVGKSRSHVANMLRLTSLPTVVRKHVELGQLSMGHARALLSASDPVMVAAEVVARGLSVRETEKLAAKGVDSAKSSSGSDKKKPKGGGLPSEGGKDADTKALERDLEATLGLSVAIEHGKKGGTVTLAYETLEQLDDVCRRLMGTAI